METTENNTVPSEATRIQEYFDSYIPKSVPPAAWAPVREEANELVSRAGEERLDRVRKDVQALTAAAGHLVTRGAELTLEALLHDTTLLEFDQAILQHKATGTRENLRGRLRRLQAVHAGLPWRRERRPDGERTTSLPGTNLVEVLTAVDQLAEEAHSSDAAAWRVMSREVRTTRGRTDADDINPDLWPAARQFACSVGHPITRPQLRAAVVHEALLTATPLPLAVDRLGLSRRELDLALVHPAASGTPSLAALNALRGHATS